MRTAVIVDAIRTPMGKGKPGGALSGLHAVDLLSQVLRQIVARNQLDPAQVEDVVTGCVSQVGEQSATPGRMAWLGAGLPEHVPATTIDRKCGSSQQAVTFGAYGVMAGQQDIVIACGVESMSRVVMGSARLDADPYGTGVSQRYAPGLVSQGLAAELVAERWKLSRIELDTLAVRSHDLAAAATAAGHSAKEIVPIMTPGGEVTADETIRPGSSVERLSGLASPFRTPEAEARFPELDFKITAGNSSQITDGAAALLIMSEEAAKAHGLRPRARLHSFSQVADDPMLMLTAPIPATRAVLDRARLSLADIDLFEVNEAFASVPLAWARELGISDEVLDAKVNVRGGAIALGHPLGASGARLMTTLLATLEERDLTWGLQTMCEAGGMANATIIERI